MIASLQFNLPEEADWHKQACGAHEFASLLSDMDNVARNALKHGHEFKTPEEVLKWVREQVQEVNHLLYQ